MKHVTRTNLIGLLPAFWFAAIGAPMAIYSIVHSHWLCAAFCAGLLAVNGWFTYDFWWGGTQRRSREIDEIRARRDERPL